jgi:cholesterol transport system auxiliary component
LPPLVDKLDRTLTNLDQATGNANKILGDNREAIADFSQNGLAQVGPTLAELRLVLPRPAPRGQPPRPAPRRLPHRQDQPVEFDHESPYGNPRSAAKPGRREAPCRPSVQDCRPPPRRPRGCGVLGGAEPIQIVDPSTRVAPDASWPRADWSLLVPRPARGPGDRQRSASWCARRPARCRSTRAPPGPTRRPTWCRPCSCARFEDSGRIVSVARPGEALRGEFQLASELRAFESVYSGATPEAVIELHARLVRVSDGKAVSARTFRIAEPASGTESAR